MAKWKVTPGTVNNTMSGSIEYDGASGDSYWQIYQDEKPFLEQAKMDRESSTKSTPFGYKKFATIPDIVAIEIKEKYGIDCHDPTFLHDDDMKAKFMMLIKTHYKYLLSYE